MTAAPASQVAVTLCPGGPMLLRGATEVRDDDGQVHPVTRPVVALCRCQRSERMPWCDSSHKAPRPPTPATGTSAETSAGSRTGPSNDEEDR